MTGCPTENGNGCKQMEDMETHMYGKDGKGGVEGEGGLREQIKSCLTYRSLWSFIGSIVVIALAVFIAVNTMWRDVEVLKVEKTQLQKDVGEIKSDMKDVLKILRKQDSYPYTPTAQDKYNEVAK
jgi:hypothetical protein